MEGNATKEWLKLIHFTDDKKRGPEKSLVLGHKENQERRGQRHGLESALGLFQQTPKALSLLPFAYRTQRNKPRLKAGDANSQPTSHMSRHVI